MADCGCCTILVSQIKFSGKIRLRAFIHVISPSMQHHFEFDSFRGDRRQKNGMTSTEGSSFEWLSRELGNKEGKLEWLSRELKNQEDKLGRNHIEVSSNNSIMYPTMMSVLCDVDSIIFYCTPPPPRPPERVPRSD